MADDCLVVGVDCAAQTPRTAIALGKLSAGRLTAESVVVGGKDPATDIVDYIGATSRVVVAIDAPLGWPEPLGATLVKHSAGEPISTIPNDLFRRETDRVVKASIGKQSLDVGADKIARVAWAALGLVKQLRERLTCDVEVATRRDDESGCRVIEVYPAATLAAMGLPSGGYKGNKAQQEQARISLESQVRDRVSYDERIRDLMISSDDALDAVLCLIAAEDYVTDKCIPPQDPVLAQKEGWIWVRKPR